MHRRYWKPIKLPAQIPNELIGKSLFVAVTKNAVDVVKDLTIAKSPRK